MHNRDDHMRKSQGLFSSFFWQSAFRPFYLLGGLYGLGIMAVWLLRMLGYIDLIPAEYSLSIWHGHEMVFGFAGALVVGFVLTALPGWAGTEEIRQGPLVLLVILWGLGRMAFHSGTMMPMTLVMGVDSSLFLVMMLLVAPGLIRAENKFYLALLPILFLMFLGNILFYLAVMDGDLPRASWAIHMGLMALVAKFILAGGYLTSVFTRNALRQKGLKGITVHIPLEYVSALSLILFIYAVLVEVPEGISAGFAFFAALIQFIRMLRWRTLQILEAPLVVVMHLAFAWLIVALLLYGAAYYVPEIPPMAWIHAFTIGALSMMMLSLITRVVLRHTGRPLVPAKAMILSFMMMFLCSFLRVGVSLDLLPADWLPISAEIWWFSFLIYLLLHGLFMIRPSLPKRQKPQEDNRTPEERASEIGPFPSS